jgi:hypothetical protein
MRWVVASHHLNNRGLRFSANAPGALADNGIPLFFRLYEAKRDSIINWQENEKNLPAAKTMLP